MARVRTLALGTAVVTLLALCPVQAAAQGASAAARCADLQSVQLPQTTLSVETVETGMFTPPEGDARPGGPPPAAITDLPAFCRVSGRIRNHPTSNINFEMWLPTQNANQRFAQVGNGGFAGTINYRALAVRARAGYAAISTDDGTAPSSDKSFLADLERVADFKGRAVTLTTERGKALFEKFYGRRPQYSYFTGGSTGGLEALAVVQRIPAQFDGVSAGCPAFNSAGLFTQALWTFKYMQPVEDKLPMIHAAALAACDMDDGVKDGNIGSPLKCGFDPGTLACRPGADPGSCLTADQVQAVRHIYQGPVNPATGTKTGEEYAPGMVPGSELAWTGSRNQAINTAQPWYGAMLYGTPTFDLTRFDFGADVQKALAKTKPYGVQVTNSDLSEFRNSGGKLLIYAGWNDPLWSQADIVRYYREVVARQGGSSALSQEPDPRALEETKRFARLFMAPGMGHCGGGDGPNVFDDFGALVNWVEKGQAPDTLFATKYVSNQPAQGVERTRPLCTYPLIARWNGTGDPMRGENFSCVVP
jgi:feruloyl esterase